VLPLAKHFLARFAAEYGVRGARLTAAAERALSQREWPGNVRELRNVMERAVLLAASPAIDARDVIGESTAPLDGEIPFPSPLNDVIRAAALRMLARSDGNKSDAARRLGITRARLQRILDAADETPDPDPTDV
jgi:DNA-binding NtrC family response regulator